MEQARPQENPIWTAVSWSILFAGLFAALLFFSMRKTLVITDQTFLTEESHANAPASRDFDLKLKATGDRNVLYVPLAEDVSPEQVMVENRYLSRQMHIHIRGGDEEFYRQRPLYGDISSLTAAFCVQEEDTLYLILETDRIREYRTTVEGNTMAISFSMPDEQYPMIVVLDPVGEDSDTTLQVAAQVAGLLGREDIRIYQTRTENSRLTDEEKIYFTAETRADAYIQIGVGSSEDDGQYGIEAEYNDRYFLPDYGNVQLSDALIRNVALCSVNRGLGMKAASPDSMLMRLTIPASRINVGFVTNEQENLLMQQEEYRTKLAQGIADAIAEAAESLER